MIHIVIKHQSTKSSQKSYLYNIYAYKKFFWPNVDELSVTDRQTDGPTRIIEKKHAFKED